MPPPSKIRSGRPAAPITFTHHPAYPPYPTNMVQEQLRDGFGRPVSRIRCPRSSDPWAFTTEALRSGLMAHDEPTYPEDARVRGVEGKVVLDARIDRDDAIETLTVRAGHPMLAESALQTIRNWR